MTTLAIMEARRKLTTLPEMLQRTPGAVKVTRHGKPVLAVLPWELYESIEETLEVMTDPDLVKALRASLRDIAAGRTLSMEEVARRHGLEV